MWSGNEECNDEDRPVRLYQPIQYGRSQIRVDNPTASFIGGPTSASSRQCPCCKQNLVTLVQLHIPNTDRTLRVEACNSASCFRTLFESSSKFHYGGDGVVACERLVVPQNVPEPSLSVEFETECMPKTVDDWGVSGDEDAGLDDLEAKLAVMEATCSSGSKQAIPKAAKQSSAVKTKEKCVLPVMVLHSMQEPPSRTVSADPRDVGLHGTSNRKVEEMLARYLENEEDQDIVQMLKGTASTGAGGQEPDKDLTEDEMALLKFSDRIKRAPRQVIRYAYGGEPLWSM